MEARLEFNGAGGDLFKKMIVGAILTVITFGIYLPWFIVALQRFVYENTLVKRTAKGELRVDFTGTGGELFKIGLVGYLLSALTLGIYLPWFLVNLNRFFLEHSVARAADGTSYKLSSALTGGELFKTGIVGYLLSAITLGIYLPWFIVNVQKLFLENTQIFENGQPIGRCDFVGKGGDLLVTMLVGYLLTVVTLGIYAAWMQVNLLKFFASNTQLRIRGRVFAGDFVGKGADYFVLMLVGYLLTMITFGIYGFWFMAKLIKFQLDNLVYRPAAPEMLDQPAPRMAMPASA